MILLPTGTSTFTTVDIYGGAIDGTNIGATTAGTGRFSNSVATGGYTGSVAGDVTGDIYASNGTSKVLENGTDG